MRGPKPTPTALKILRGNPGQYPLNRDEPIPAALAAEPVPHELKDAHARAEWRRLVPGLLACGQVTLADRTLLVGHCVKVGQWLRLEEEVLRHPLSEPDELGPALRVMRAANRAFELVIRSGNDLGLSPTTRTRVTRTPAPAVSKWAGALP